MASTGYGREMPRTAESARAAATRRRLLDAAEELFAVRGIDSVSLREIALATDQRNNGVAQYHFGDKAGLVRAVFERRAAAVTAARLARLDQLVADDRSSVHDLVRGFIEPLAEQVA